MLRKRSAAKAQSLRVLRWMRTIRGVQASLEGNWRVVEEITVRSRSGAAQPGLLRVVRLGSVPPCVGK